MMHLAKISAAACLVWLCAGDRVLVGVDCEINNNGANDWQHVVGDPVVWFDVESGSDTENEDGHWKMLIGATYGDAKPGTRVITNLWAHARNDATVYCPSDYERICNWDSEGATGSDGRTGHWMITLCAKYETCSKNKNAVNGFISNSGNDSWTPSRIGSYYRFLEFDADEGGAWSANDGSSGHWNTAFYQKKGVCTRSEGGFRVLSGTSYCSVDSNGCVHDGNNSYSNNEYCKFEFNGDAIIYAQVWDIESHSTCAWDYMQVDGKKYCGSSGFSKLVTGNTQFVWSTDSSVTRAGFKLCVQSWN